METEIRPEKSWVGEFLQRDRFTTRASLCISHSSKSDIHEIIMNPLDE